MLNKKNPNAHMLNKKPNAHMLHNAVPQLSPALLALLAPPEHVRLAVPQLRLKDPHQPRPLDQLADREQLQQLPVIWVLFILVYFLFLTSKCKHW